MKTRKQIDDDMLTVEIHIRRLLADYDMDLRMLYDEGVAIVLRYTQRNESGDLESIESELNI